MSETVEMYQAMREGNKLVRRMFGEPCPECVKKLPKASPSILLPQQVCRIHRHRDPRPELSQADYDKAYATP